MEEFNWLSPTVASLCAAMRQDHDYVDSSMLALADALVVAGCDDEELLASCRDAGQSPIERQRVICLVLGDKYAAAVRTIEKIAADMADGYYDDFEGQSSRRSDADENYDSDDYASRFDRVDMTYALLMSFARTAVESIDENGYIDYHVTEMGSEHWRYVLSKNNQDFWEAYGHITSAEPTFRGKFANFFSCSC